MHPNRKEDCPIRILWLWAAQRKISDPYFYARRDCGFRLRESVRNEKCAGDDGHHSSDIGYSRFVIHYVWQSSEFTATIGLGRLK